jgi:hypothetical protein
MHALACTWTTQGNIICETYTTPSRVCIMKPKEDNTNIEAFANDFLYSFNIYVYDIEENVVFKQMFVNVSPSKSKLVFQIRPTTSDMIGDKVRLVITDVTMYTGNYRQLPLKFLLEVDPKVMLIPVVFSDMPPIDNVYYRTAEIHVPSYNGFKLYFDH